MRPIFIVTLISFLLTACGSHAPQVTVTSEVTVTLPPAITFTATPSFTVTPTATAVPTLTPEQQVTVNSLNTTLAGVWTIDKTGAVLGAPEGVTYNVDKGVLTRTYIYEGIELTVDLTINTETPMPEGCIANFEGWCLPARGENQTEVVDLARKTYSTAGGYGYEGDGKVGEPLLSRLEAQAILADENRVDMTTREFNMIAMEKPHSGSKGLMYGAIETGTRRFGWATNKVPVTDEEGRVSLKDTTVYYARELDNSQVMVIFYWGVDHESDSKALSKIMLVDSGEPVPDDYETKHPVEWNNMIYGPISEGGQNIAVEW